MSRNSVPMQICLRSIANDCIKLHQYYKCITTVRRIDGTNGYNGDISTYVWKLKPIEI